MNEIMKSTITSMEVAEMVDKYFEGSYNESYNKEENEENIHN